MDVRNECWHYFSLGLGDEHNTQINHMQLYFSIARVFPDFLPSRIHPTLFQNGHVLPLLNIRVIVHSYKISEAEQTNLSSFNTL